MPKVFHLLEVNAEGYLLAGKSGRLCVPHEAVVAILAGIRGSQALSDANEDALRRVLKVFEVDAWRQGCCSFTSDHKPIDLGPGPIMASE